jgi:hypothetical protein
MKLMEDFFWKRRERTFVSENPLLLHQEIVDKKNINGNTKNDNQ